MSDLTDAQILLIITTYRDAYIPATFRETFAALLAEAAERGLL